MQNGSNTLRSLTLFVSSHFMFNVLGKMQSEILGGEKREAISTLTLYSRLVRQACSIAHSDKISLNDEALFLENYLKLEKDRFIETPFNYSILGFDKDEIYIEPFLLQPFVELAVLGGLGRVGGLISIEYMTTENAIMLISVMQFKDVNEKLSEKLNVAKERLTFFNHRYEIVEEEHRFLQKISL